MVTCVYIRGMYIHCLWLVNCGWTLFNRPPGHHQSSPAGTASSSRRTNFTLISVTLSPFNWSWTNHTATSIWIWNTSLMRQKQGWAQVTLIINSSSAASPIPFDLIPIAFFKFPFFSIPLETVSFQFPLQFPFTCVHIKLCKVKIPSR